MTCRAIVVLVALAVAPSARAQLDPPFAGGGPGGSVSCSELNNRAMEATMVIRQHASTLSTGIDPESKAQGMLALGWLDQWTGRLRGLVDVAESSSCLDDGDAETYRRALATAIRVGNTAREELLRPPRATPQQRRRS